MTRPDDPEQHHFARAVTLRRERLGLTQAEAYKKAGISRSAWHHIETGRTKNPQTDTLNGIARALQTDSTTIRAVLRGETDSWDRGATWDSGATWDLAGPAWVVQVKSTVGAVEADRGRLMELAATMNAEQVHEVRKFAEAMLAS
jgi:transcriptional regulator with XRE-family HTH domain